MYFNGNSAGNEGEAAVDLYKSIFDDQSNCKEGTDFCYMRHM